ncbi:MAG TPA: hypothetical protein VN519_02580 [Bryobacteraceae bacterium]|nr:hypothetical protein [Bryobacteraceae bacterium]
MAVSKNSRNSRRSDASGLAPALSVLICAAACLIVMGCAAWHFYATGVTLWYGDAEAHLNIARRVVDSRTPGLSQLGTTWLPLPHLMMIPFVRNDELWKTGLAGAIPAAFCTALAGTFLFAAIRRLSGSAIAAAAATAVFLLNPNTLYLGSIPMSEPYYFASLFGLLYFSVRFSDTRGWGAIFGMTISANCAALTRYEGWFLIPFVAAFILVRGKGIFGRVGGAVVFGVLASLGPLLWMFYNRWYFADPLYFYRGPWSAAGIQGNTYYPGRGNWRMALQYFIEAGKLAIGVPGLLLGAAGAAAALARRWFWAVLLVTLPPVFYVWSIHSSSTPIFVPTLWPHSFYNTRYAMALLPFVAIGVAAVARFGRIPAVLAVVIAFTPVFLHPRDHSITWQESDVNSRDRRAWVADAANYLRHAMGPHETFITSFSDMTAVYRILGIPLRNTLTGDNDVEFVMTMARPEIFLHTDWALVTGGDPIQTMIDRARRDGPKFELKHRVIVKGEPALEIYKRVGEPPPLPPGDVLF